MAENSMFNESTSAASISSEENSDNVRLDDHEIREIELEINTERTKKQKLSTRGAGCDTKECILGVAEKFAMYLCYYCNSFLCEECFKVHNTNHEFVRIESEETERKGMAYILMKNMRTEEKKRELNLNVKETKVYGRVNVKHGLEEDCRTFGICGIQNKRWTFLDSRNYCMKVFSSVTNTILRYIRLGSQPWGVVEIELKCTDTDSSSDSKSAVSLAARHKHSKRYLVAVTFPWLKQIWFIDLNTNPAVKTKTKEMHKLCESIDFCDEKIFTLCDEAVVSEFRYSVDILSAEGNPIKVIKLDLNRYIRDLAVFEDKIYVTDYENDRVLCISARDGKTLSQITIEGSELTGICVDPSNNVYVSGSDHDRVYKLYPGLDGFEPVCLDTQYTQSTGRICFADNKLFVGHYWGSSLGNFVTVFQLT